jgi:hypothetical protein
MGIPKKEISRNRNNCFFIKKSLWIKILFIITGYLLVYCTYKTSLNGFVNDNMIYPRSVVLVKIKIKLLLVMELWFDIVLTKENKNRKLKRNASIDRFLFQKIMKYLAKFETKT